MSTVDVAAIGQRVAAGAEWLDQQRPGWWLRINLQTLRLQNPCRCVLGQEYGSFYDAPLVPGVRLGFDAPYGHPGEFAALTAEWKRVIQARRAQAGA